MNRQADSKRLCLRRVQGTRRSPWHQDPSPTPSTVSYRVVFHAWMIIKVFDACSIISVWALGYTMDPVGSQKSSDLKCPLDRKYSMPSLCNTVTTLGSS